MFFDSVSPGEDSRIFLVEGDAQFTFDAVFQLGDALYSGLPRAVALILLDRTHEAIAAYLGALRNGIVAFVVDGAITERSLRSAIKAYKPAYIFAPTTFDHFGYRRARTLGTKALFVDGSATDTGIAGDLALLMPTSGSTGDPKCVRLTAANIDACTRAVTAYLDMTPERTALTTLPLHYAYGLSILHNAVSSRSRLVLTQCSVIEREMWSLAEAWGVTDLAGVPFTFELMRRIRLSDSVLGTLRCVTQAGGRLDPNLTRHFLDYFGSRQIAYFTMYGQTEAGPRISYLPPDRGHDKAGTVGIALPIGRTEIAETGLAYGEGELVYVGPNVCMGYAFSHSDLDKGDEFNGRLATGDQVSLDRDGFITVVGRKKRFVKVHGVSVNLDHAEAVLQAKGLDCMVVGQDNRVSIFVHDAHVDAAREAVRASFNFHPSAVKLVSRDTLPRTAAGKPDYMRLQQDA